MVPVTTAGTQIDEHMGHGVTLVIMLKSGTIATFQDVVSNWTVHTYVYIYRKCVITHNSLSRL